MHAGDLVPVSGCFTKEKFIAGRTLAEIERILGFHAGRLSAGMAVVALTELPSIQQFDLGAYSNVATHRQGSQEGLNIERIKADARGTWTTFGFERVVKVIPATGHNPAVNPDIQYPPGLGAPQWIARVPLMGRVIAVVSGYPHSRYLAAGGMGR